MPKVRGMTFNEEENNPLVCFCFNIKLHEVQTIIIQEDVHTIFDIMARCKAGNGCTSCWPLLEELLSLKPPEPGGF